MLLGIYRDSVANKNWKQWQQQLQFACVNFHYQDEKSGQMAHRSYEQWLCLLHGSQWVSTDLDFLNYLFAKWADFGRALNCHVSCTLKPVQQQIQLQQKWE